MQGTFEFMQDLKTQVKLCRHALSDDQVALRTNISADPGFVKTKMKCIFLTES